MVSKLDSLLESVFESTADGLLVVDLNGKIIRSNTHFKVMWKIPDELISSGDDGKLLTFIVDQLLEPAEFLDKVLYLYKNPEEISEDTIAFKDGRFFSRHSRPLMFNGEITGRVWSFLDITKQKRSEEVFRAITEISPDIISILSPDGVLLFNSPAAERIHGYKHHELIGRNTFELIHPEDQPSCQSAMDALISGQEKVVSVQYRYKNAKGGYDIMEATASNEIGNPLINGLVVISREIGPRKKLEEDLQQALKNLENFISTISHELKTPVTGIKLQLQILERNGLTHLAEGKRSSDIAALIRQVDGLGRLVDDLLQMSRMRRGKFTFEMREEDFSGVILENVDRLESLLASSQCQLSTAIAPGITVRCDRVRIEQVLINLISNVVRYAPGRPVGLTLEERDGFAELRVKDHGPGIERERLEQIFLPFNTSPKVTGAGGLGVGLFISKTIIEQHQGELLVEESGHRGTTFLIRLPVLK